MKTLSLIRPDDWHLHLRDGAMLATVVPHSARQFARAIVMPNLQPAVTTTEMALAYRQRILQAVPANTRFDPLMTLYLTESTDKEEVERAAGNSAIAAFKLYPAGATTHSDAGVTQLERIYPVLEAMERHDIPLLVHAEVSNAEVDIFDRERYFIDRHLRPIVHQFPGLRLVLEHATTREAIAFVRESGPQIAATLTPQHLLYNRNHLLAGGLRPHFYCLPVLKRESHRQVLLEAATSGDPKFFLGTDSAPHPRSRKESACGCAGCYSANAALEWYAEIFERAGALDKLEGFASFHGADFYRLPRNREQIVLEKKPWRLPDNFPVENETLVPLGAGETLSWRLLTAATD